jgi:prepilin-type N-terminal cleavage/methylation domain-containing protein
MKKAFTLVELAIVIVIIGLLVGGVLAGQELIKQAKMRTLMRDIEGYKTSMLTFKAKYNCLPGDCKNAYTFFADHNCGTNTIISSSNITGCNGNGDSVFTYAEGQIAWNHLGSAKMVKGTYSPGYKAEITAGNDVPFINVKDSVGASVIYAQGDPHSTNSCGYQYCTDVNPENIHAYMIGKNVFAVGSVRTDPFGQRFFARGAFFTALEALEFDTKFDDGLPIRGVVSGFKGRLVDGSQGFCIDYPSGYSRGTYLVASYNREACMMVFDAGLN